MEPPINNSKFVLLKGYLEIKNSCMVVVRSYLQLCIAVNIEGLQTSFLHFIYTSKGNVTLHLKSQEIVLEKCNLQCLAKDRKGMMILCLALESCYHEILSGNIVLMGGIRKTNDTSVQHGMCGAS